jgi:hypothetical protein
VILEVAGSSPVTHPNCLEALRFPTTLVVDDPRNPIAPVKRRPSGPRRRTIAIDDNLNDGPQLVQILTEPQVLALPAFHCTQGMFQSPSPSVPGSVDPTVLMTSTMSPLLLWS